MHQWPFRRSSIGLLLLRIAATAMLLLFGHGDVNQLPPLPFQIVGLVLSGAFLPAFVPRLWRCCWRLLKQTR